MLPYYLLGVDKGPKNIFIKNNKIINLCLLYKERTVDENNLCVLGNLVINNKIVLDTFDNEVEKVKSVNFIQLEDSKSLFKFRKIPYTNNYISIDANIVNISWNELNKLHLIYGKKIILNNNEYLLRAPILDEVSYMSKLYEDYYINKQPLYSKTILKVKSKPKNTKRKLCYQMRRKNTEYVLPDEDFIVAYRLVLEKL